MTATTTHLVYGEPARDLTTVPTGAVQCSPLMPDSASVSDYADAGVQSAVVYAPPATLERRYVLACMLNALAIGAPLVALAPKDKGGSRLADDLTRFGCTVQDEPRRHHRVVTTTRPATLHGIADAITAGSYQQHPAHGLWTHPGVFSWDRLDAGSALLLKHLPELAGTGADLGCGIGVLARAVLASPSVTALTLIDIDRRAVGAASRNISDARANFLWADVCEAEALPLGLDFVVMNPPFHDAGIEEKALGQAFIKSAAFMLRPGGVCWLVANRHLPYEALLNTHFSRNRLVVDDGGFKVFESVK
jgi:16S rRNA (guanine1207-N2)-methyltransferase